MPQSSQEIIDLETRFWQAMVDQDHDTAVSLLTAKAVMVSAHGALQFDQAAYRKMAEQGPVVVTAFAFSDMQVLFPTETTAVLTYRVRQRVAPRGKGQGEGSEQEVTDSSTWVQVDGAWKCVMHTETPLANKQ